MQTFTPPPFNASQFLPPSQVPEKICHIHTSKDGTLTGIVESDEGVVALVGYGQWVTGDGRVLDSSELPVNN